jgi:hypothetical protein
MKKINYSKRFRFNIDAEFAPKNESKKFDHKKSTYYNTIPLTIQVRQDNIPLGNGKIYSHQDSHESAKAHYPEFKHDLVVFDYLEDTQQAKVSKEVASKRTKKALIEMFFFYSPKDIEYSIKGNISQGKTKVKTRELLLNCFSRTRRIMTKVPKGNGRYSNEIPTDYVLEIDNEPHKVYIRYVDVCGLTNVGLKGTSETYLGKMDFKDNLSIEQKENLIKANILGTESFNQYALGDLCMTDIFDASVETENVLRRELGIQENTVDDKKLTVGATSARMLRDYCRVYLKQPELQLNNYSVYTSPKNIQRLVSQFRKSKEITSLPYLAMVDGGRCVRELSKRPGFYNLLSLTYHPCLVDIDIDGCYGNGLKSQKFAIGNPTIDTGEMTIREFMKKYHKDLVPGLWQARIFGKLGEFSQDLIISKTRESVDAYLKKMKNHDIDDLESALISNMCCLTNEVHAGLMNNDVLELILNYTSNTELNQWLDEVKVIGFCGYLKCDRVDDYSLMVEGYASTDKDKKNKQNIVTYSTRWLEIPLDEYASKLLAIRKNYPKKSPMNEFCKLIINSTYGVICSEYFDTDDTGISNVIVANNITARARVLAFCMAKALGSAMSITDGGMFNVNLVNYLTGARKKVTLTSLANLTDDVYTSGNRTILFEQKPLLEREVNLTDYANENKVEELIALIKEIDRKAWEHCSNMFSELTIFKERQYSFESKNVYDSVVLHNKSDYIATNSLFTYTPKKDEKNPAKIVIEPLVLHKQRGTKGEAALNSSKVLYEAIKEHTPTSVNYSQDTLIGLSEYQRTFGKVAELTEEELIDDECCDVYEPEYESNLANKFIEHDIYPGDVKESKRTLYSHIPTCMKHTTLKEFEKSKQIADEMRDRNDPRIGFERMKELGWM